MMPNPYFWGMKMKLSLRFLLLALLFAAANTVVAQHTSSWKEMDAFHDVMSETFHPSEEGNLQPIKTRIDEMVTKAKAWRKSSVPAAYDAKKSKAKLKELEKGAEALRKTIRNNGSDPDITKQLAELHDVFHYIMEKCRK
jgi:tRNA nucleotidyltransferase/poly(A) polymerase